MSVGFAEVNTSVPQDERERVSLVCQHEGTCWWAESPEVPGWTVIGESLAEVTALAFEGVSFMLGRPARISSVAVYC